MNAYPNSCVVRTPEDSCFDLLTDDEKKLVDDNMVEVHYKKGEIICKQGSFASKIIYLSEGLVKVYLEGSPKNLVLTITPKNNMVGLPSIFEGNNTFLYSVSPYVDSWARLIDINVFKQILKQNAAFASKIIDILNENTAQAYGRFFCLTRKQLHGRMADILMCLSERIFKSLEYDLPLSRNDLAELTGMSTESVIRLVKEFKDDRIIEVSGKSIRILDPERLRKISSVG
ncbi:MAG: Crp/Fnr family transcriptional regulator [Bacteroidales bacterium]|jgi:CRP/FNR family transcriptional regulator|nr:Crp/Fnr family transcriptional regulator [Bacteroidales bacterium]